MLPLLTGAGRLLASGAGKKVADSASKRAAGTAGKKLSKDKFFNKEEKQESDDVKTGIVRSSISPAKLLPPSDIKDPPKKVDLSKGGEEGGIKDTFDKIDDTLNGIISSINRENQFRKKESEDSRKKAELENKQRQENKLERGGKSRGIGPSIKLPGDGFGIGKFFKNILMKVQRRILFSKLPHLLPIVLIALSNRFYYRKNKGIPLQFLLKKQIETFWLITFLMEP